MLRCFKFFEYSTKNSQNCYRTNIYKEAVTKVAEKWSGFSRFWPMNSPKQSEESSSSDMSKLHQQSPTHALENKKDSVSETFESCDDESISEGEVASAKIPQGKQTKICEKSNSSFYQNFAAFHPKSEQSSLNLIVISDAPRDFNETSSKLKSFLTTSSNMKLFISALIHRFKNSQHILKIFKELEDFSIVEKLGEKITFKQILIETITVEFAISNSKQKLTESALSSFSNLLLTVGELYREDLLSEEDIAIWFMHKHIKHVSVEKLSIFSSLVSSKIHSSGQRNMTRFLENLETMIFDATLTTCRLMKNDLDELLKLLTDY